MAKRIKKKRKKKNLLNRKSIEILKKKLKDVKKKVKPEIIEKKFQKVKEFNQIVHENSAINLEESLKEIKSPVLEKIAIAEENQPSDIFPSHLQEDNKGEINYETKNINYNSDPETRNDPTRYSSIIEHPNIAEPPQVDDKNFLEKRQIAEEGNFTRRELNERMWANKTGTEKDISNSYSKKADLYSKKINADDKKYI